VPIAPGGITEEHREARPQTPSFSEPPAGGGHDRRTAPDPAGRQHTTTAAAKGRRALHTRTVQQQIV